MTSLPLPEKRMMTSEEAASYCGFSSVNGFLAHIKVEPVRFGKSVRYDRMDLDDYLNTFRHAAPKRKISELVGNAGQGRGH